MKYFLIFFFLFALTACKITRLSNINLVSIYKHEEPDIYPEYYLFHNSKNTSTLYYKIDSDKLLYLKQPESNTFAAKYSIHYNLVPSFNSNNLLDSATVFKTDSAHFESEDYFIDSIEIETPPEDEFLIHLTFSDRQTRQSHVYVLKANKSGKYNSQNFLFYNKNNEMLFKPFIQKQSEITALHNTDKDFVMNAKLFKEPKSPALPPFVSENESSNDLEPDSTYEISFTNGKAKILINQHGLYRFFKNDNPSNGFSFHFFHDGYPLITTHSAMIAPVRYLVSRKEYQKIISAQDSHSAIDRFWVSIAGDTQRARSLVSRYYNNIEWANYYFTSYKEGWKTDRGMIYTIFGPPEDVFISDYGEKWRYRDLWGISEIEFDFKRKQHKFAENHYVLDRSTAYRNPWFMGIENWRR